MGLDATVYCDCYEKGRLREGPPGDGSLRVEPDGSLNRQDEKGTIEDALAWDQWREHEACEHTGGVLLHHRLGNISLIGLLRSELNREPSRFPILLTKVLYSGTHAGDYLAFDVIPALQREFEALDDFNFSTKNEEVFKLQFQTKMSELIAASISVAKPIAF